MQHFQKEMKGLHEPDPDGIIQRALKIKYNTKKMKKLAGIQETVASQRHYISVAINV